jgi:hypothetical protein
MLTLRSTKVLPPRPSGWLKLALRGFARNPLDAFRDASLRPQRDRTRGLPHGAVTLLGRVDMRDLPLYRS